MAPLAIVSIIMFGFWETLVFKPEKISTEAMDELKSKLEEHGKLNNKEWKTMIVIGAMLLCWILGTWIKVFDTTLVAVWHFYLCQVWMFWTGKKLQLESTGIFH